MLIICNDLVSIEGQLSINKNEQLIPHTEIFILQHVEPSFVGIIHTVPAIYTYLQKFKFFK